MPQAAGFYPGDAPPGVAEEPKPEQLPESPPAVLGSIHYFLLPYIGEKDLQMCWRGWTQPEVFLDQNPNGIPPALYLCPSQVTSDPPGVIAIPWDEHPRGRRLGVTSYAANIQGLGHWWPTQPSNKVKPRRSSIADGAGFTVAMAERYHACPDSGTGRTGWLGTFASQFDAVFAWNEGEEAVILAPQIAPIAAACDPRAAQTAHPGGMNVLMIDGSVRRVKSIDEDIWKRMVMPDDAATASTAAL